MVPIALSYLCEVFFSLPEFSTIDWRSFMLVIYAHPNCRNIGKICNFCDSNAICYERIDLVKSLVHIP